MRILVLNCGSSSLKYACFDLPEESPVHSGTFERIGEAGAPATHADAVASVGETLRRGGLDGLDGIGHRVVHGGEDFGASTRIDDDVLASIDALSALAPLHNPVAAAGIRAAGSRFPGVPQVAVFDTAFHQTLPDSAYRFAIPNRFYEQNRIRRYGFHGTSHRFVAGRAAALIGKATFTGVTCHLGNGSSVTAVHDGRSVDTSMGLTPLGGVAMGTRSGDLDPAVVLYLQSELGLDADTVGRMLNEESGLLGLSGISNDLRAVEQAARQGDERAELAIEVFAHQVSRYVGAYAAMLPEPDGIVFTGGIGENAADTRARIVSRLEGLPVAIDAGKNEGAIGREADISGPTSELRLLVIPTNEELAIAADTATLIDGRQAD